MGDGKGSCPAIRSLVAILAALLVPGTARAAGGADAVDDAYAETPRVCHVENWLIASVEGGGGALQHVGVGCTTARPPRLEIDAAAREAQGAGTTVTLGLTVRM